MNSSPTKIGFVSLGCPKALVDSEQIITRLRTEGYEISASYEQADMVVVNTCGFIDDAIEESLDAIGEALNENGKVVVTGCLGTQGDLVRKQFPEVLAITGPHAAHEVMEAIHAHLPPQHDPLTNLVPPQGIRLTPKHYAYLKISEGCNHRCTFCIIPTLRGNLVSRPIGQVMQEAENLVNAGVRELLVIAQDTSAYGVDTRYKLDFWGGKPLKTRFFPLVEALGELDCWVRLHYVYPYPHVDEVIPLMATGKILPYLDIPFQHASPAILKAMKRPAHSENTLERIRQWRSICPDITLRSTFVVGFPGETDADFHHLLDFLHEAQLDRVGAFAYSAVDGAVANTLPNPVPEELKQRRLEQFMAVQTAISATKRQQLIGNEMVVIIDEVNESGIVARSPGDAPEVDGLVHISTETGTGAELQPGDFIEVTIIDAAAHDLFASIKTS